MMLTNTNYLLNVLERHFPKLKKKNKRQKPKQKIANEYGSLKNLKFLHVMANFCFYAFTYLNSSCTKIGQTAEKKGIH